MENLKVPGRGLSQRAKNMAIVLRGVFELQSRDSIDVVNMSGLRNLLIGNNSINPHGLEEGLNSAIYCNYIARDGKFSTETGSCVSLNITSEGLQFLCDVYEAGIQNLRIELNNNVSFQSRVKEAMK